jgi:MscS family membrane protein
LKWRKRNPPPVPASLRPFSHLRICSILFSLVLLLSISALAQVSIPKPAPATPQSEAPVDPLGRTTPRSAVFGFLTAARKGEDGLAAQYLNTNLRGKDASVLAHQLFTVLDRRLPPRLNQLSDKPDGAFADALHPNQELVGTIRSDNGDVDIFLQRVDRGKSGQLWLFSSKTLESVPALFDEADTVSVYEILPNFLLNNRLDGIPLFEWLAVFIGLPFLYFLTGLLDPIFRRLNGLVRRLRHGKPYLVRPESLPKPIRLLLLAFAIHWINSKINLPLLARQFWSNTATVITIGSIVWLLFHIVRWSEEYLRRLLQRRNVTGAASMLRLTRWVVDLLIIFLGALVTLRYFGVNPTAALAGLGVGGIAVALAAQKTLENVIGGVSLIFDQAVRVGDQLKMGPTQGVVEDIGLRSTRIRTLDRTVVSVPNGQIATMSIENISSRDKFWFHHILALRYGIMPPQMSATLDGVRRLLEQTRHLQPGSVRVRFLRFGVYSLEVEVVAYVLATDLDNFFEIQESCLLAIMEFIESAGIQFASPPLTMPPPVTTPSNAT